MTGPSLSHPEKCDRESATAAPPKSFIVSEMHDALSISIMLIMILSCISCEAPQCRDISATTIAVSPVVSPWEVLQASLWENPMSGRPVRRLTVGVFCGLSSGELT